MQSRHFNHLPKIKCVKKKKWPYSDMHVLEEDEERLPDQLEVPTGQG